MRVQLHFETVFVTKLFNEVNIALLHFVDNNVKTTGLHMGGCGEQTLRFRPALIFKQHHCELTLDILDKAIAAAK
jgi:4-aminobutyrate aminotransferase-like enzyme